MWRASKVGVFGSSEAPYGWGRWYASFHRLLGHNAHPDSWGMVYVDDGLWALPLSELWDEAALILLFHQGMGVPIGWKKTGAAMRMSWIGFSRL